MVCFPTFGGSGVVATELGWELAQRGHAVHFISYDPPFRLDPTAPNVVFHEVPIPSYPLFKFPPYLLTLASKIREVAVYERLDIVHVHYALPHTLSAFLAKLMNASHPFKIVTTLHGTDLTLVGQEEFFVPVVALSLQQSDGITAVSEYLRRRTLESFPGHDVVTIPNFVNLRHYRPHCGQGCRTSRAAIAPKGEKLVVHLSNFRPVKRLDLVIRVFARLRERLPCKLVLVGDGPDAALARRMVQELNLREDTHFLGNQEKVTNILAAADLFLLPSDEESFGLAALEAMACGVPVLAFRVGGLPEVVADGEGGFLLPPGNWEAMATRGSEILGDPGLHGRLGAAGRHRAKELFAADKIVPRYEAYYRQLLGEPEPAKPL